MIDSVDARPLPEAEPVSASQEAAAPRRRCAHCDGPFGLVRRRRAGRQFCSVACMESYDERLRRAAQARGRWFDFLNRAGLARTR